MAKIFLFCFLCYYDTSSGGVKKPPAVPSKPAHLQSPKRMNSELKIRIDIDDWESQFNAKYPSLG